MATWLPYAMIPREMFIYHYFLTSILMMLTIVFAVKKIIEWRPKFSWLILAMINIFLVVFIYFYPIYSGMQVREEYIASTKWFDSWQY